MCVSCVYPFCYYSCYSLHHCQWTPSPRAYSVSISYPRWALTLTLRPIALKWLTSQSNCASFNEKNGVWYSASHCIVFKVLLCSRGEHTINQWDSVYPLIVLYNEAQNWFNLTKTKRITEFQFLNDGMESINTSRLQNAGTETTTKYNHKRVTKHNQKTQSPNSYKAHKQT